MSGFLTYLREQLLIERDVMDTIVKLLALADRPGSPHEGEVALAQATRLAKQNNIDLEVARSMMKQQSVRRAPSNSSSVHPADKLFVELNLIMSHVPGARHGGKGERMRSGVTYHAFGAEVIVWGVSHEGTFVLVVLPINGEKEHPTMWYLVHADAGGRPGGYTMDDVLSKSTNAQDVLNALRSVDWKGLKLKREAERKEKEDAAYNNSQKLTVEAEAVVKVAEKHGYVLQPAHTGMSYRYMYAEPYRLVIGPDGAWWHETRQGSVATDKWKYDTKRFDQKNKGGLALEKWITTKRKSGEAAFSVHDEVNKIAKVLTHFGFKPTEKRGNQHVWTNQVSGFDVTFGPNKMSGALKKTDDIWWMIGAVWIRKPEGGGMQPMHDVKSLLGDAKSGHTAEALETVLNKLMKRAEIGFDKVVAVCAKYGLSPNNKIAQRPDHTKEYFAAASGNYWVVVNPKNGKWDLVKKLSFGDGQMVSKSGHTADELDQVLARVKDKL